MPGVSADQLSSTLIFTVLSLLPKRWCLCYACAAAPRGAGGGDCGHWEEEMMRLQGQTAIITGGGRGIGRAIALALAQEGARTVVCARTRREVDAVVAEIEAAGGQALAVLGDMTVWHDVEELVAQSAAHFGPIDILVNNAGG